MFKTYIQRLIALIRELNKSPDVLKDFPKLLRVTSFGRWYYSRHPLIRSVLRLPLYLSFPAFMVPISMLNKPPYEDPTRGDIIRAAFGVFFFIWIWDLAATYILFRFRNESFTKTLKKEVNPHNFPTISLIIDLYMLYYVIQLAIGFAHLFIPDLIPFLTRVPNPGVGQLILLTVGAICVKLLL